MNNTRGEVFATERNEEDIETGVGSFMSDTDDEDMSMQGALLNDDDLDSEEECGEFFDTSEGLEFEEEVGGYYSTEEGDDDQAMGQQAGEFFTSDEGGSRRGDPVKGWSSEEEWQPQKKYVPNKVVYTNTKPRKSFSFKDKVPTTSEIKQAQKKKQAAYLETNRGKDMTDKSVSKPVAGKRGRPRTNDTAATPVSQTPSRPSRPKPDLNTTDQRDRQTDLEEFLECAIANNKVYDERPRITERIDKRKYVNYFERSIALELEREFEQNGRALKGKLTLNGSGTVSLPTKRDADTEKLFGRVGQEPALLLMFWDTRPTTTDTVVDESGKHKKGKFRLSIDSREYTVCIHSNKLEYRISAEQVPAKYKRLYFGGHKLGRNVDFTTEFWLMERT
ncbi:hypothetical protein CL673_00090, partial [Candidatus Bathyarchaeota archaeon]|nr:hypothetical protein [Candidatus Bathyarchaeota archaeon]